MKYGMCMISGRTTDDWGKGQVSFHAQECDRFRSYAECTRQYTPSHYGMCSMSKAAHRSAVECTCNSHCVGVRWCVFRQSHSIKHGCCRMYMSGCLIKCESALECAQQACACQYESESALECAQHARTASNTPAALPSPRTWQLLHFCTLM